MSSENCTSLFFEHAGPLFQHLNYQSTPCKQWILAGVGSFLEVEEDEQKMNRASTLPTVLKKLTVIRVIK